MALPEPTTRPPGTPADDERERWHIEDNYGAEWVMRKLAHAAERLAAVDAEHAIYLDQLAEWRSHEVGPLERDIAWATGLLEEWARKLREADPEHKTVHLPSGKVATRWVPPHPRVEDPGAVAESLARLHHPSYDSIVSARVVIDTPALTKATSLADEWLVELSCGCSTVAWHVGGGPAQLAVGLDWPYRKGEHRTDACANRHATVTAFQPGRQAVIVAAVEQRVQPVNGAALVPGRLSVTVQPTQAG